LDPFLPFQALVLGTSAWKGRNGSK
jgi:hypothetical protein